MRPAAQGGQNQDNLTTRNKELTNLLSEQKVKVNKLGYEIRDLNKTIGQLNETIGDLTTQVTELQDKLNAELHAAPKRLWLGIAIGIVLATIVWLVLG